jgi:hypothetical protein
VTAKPVKPILDYEASAALCKRFVAEVQAIASSDDATTWAHRILSAKNTLIAADARQVEDAFQAKLASFDTASNVSALETSLSVTQGSPEAAGTTSVANGVDKSQLAHPEPRRFRDKSHVKFVAKQPCLICGRTPSDAHHLRFAQRRALGRKVSDEFTVPLCRGHHREVHRCGDESGWWKKADIDPGRSARALWLETHPLPTTSDTTGLEGVAAVGAVGGDQNNAKPGRPTGKRGQNYRTKPIIAAGAQ